MKAEKSLWDSGHTKNEAYDDPAFSERTWIDKKKLKRQKGYAFVKRAMDLFLSCFGLVLISPVMIWVAYRINKEEPRASVIFAQERIGRNGRPFRMYKFRSMCVNAEEQLTDLLIKNEVKGAMFKIKEDPRVTPFGKFIRRTSLDELPQLINVIKGEMSLIGPRPPLQREVAEYSQYDKQRLLVKPGCSGAWQVSGRSDIHFEEMVELDVHYINTRTTRADLLLIVKTLKVMLTSSGAY
ncbi:MULTISPECIES: sugar transferase [Enterococcus]|uniref:sugar transferase n=1 Tax=Enterococcus TaxID=1350 RepID=UPI000A32F4C0|nr:MULTISPECIES: sugar transferase [Enterococcus]OTO76285.1 hypothetical protein A5865_000139 [Enterococcus sp. 12E11_DIV0728]OUZ17557.1 hypothetical protein A5868_002500 [Enterococcus sp. 12F9_DIV0723]